MIAAVTVPNINPMIKIDMVLRTLLAAKSTANKTKAAPKLDANAIAQFDKASDAKNPPKILEPKINKATPKLAPEEIPKTNGPANGFRNKVCIKSPLIDKPDPTKIAVKALGKRKLRMMTSQLDFALFPPVRISRISEIGMETEPILILSNSNTRIDKDKPRNCTVYLFCTINPSRLKI